ncbi:lymphocyte function-associated antigen 3-like [Esox lucius]|uniref:lymphocyte function-associated antigen 3-like n=1 Tax=Esox lucius TaxID=8010 RepID=UPI0014771CA9|nr:lymphocyte function-associated antigen 3-like [Esox lucius]
MEYSQKERLSLTNILLCLAGMCFSVAQTGEEMLTQVVGGSITFSNPTKQRGSLLYNGGTIAVVVKGNMDSSYIDSFKDRIQWDQQTAQFTIRDLTTSDSGMYVVDVKGGPKTTYQLTVYEPVSRPMLTTAGNQICSVECSVKNERDVTLSWFSGEKILNQTSNPELSIKLSLPLEVDIQDKTSYRCEAANPVTKKNVTFHFPESCKVTEVPASPLTASIIRLILLPLILLTVIITLYLYYKMKRRQKRVTKENSMDIYANVNAVEMVSPVSRDEAGP